ncbi:hypothetical protein TRAPUB_368 [Trametes pubescens]|uniref:Uncharacterized protein n=1 Tax=Trametes pubescens TaxID=154538 RepID=A0A1M2VMG3_TRAPU|nr:hypothetical protein TRAPUB_368 [Trametes pubescens]
MILFVDPISSILNSRFLLALHETNARLEGAVDASITSLSLNISSGDDPRAGSPELPQFLGPIGGLIHSLPDDDLESLEFAPSAPSQRETLRDPEAEVGGEPA